MKKRDKTLSVAVLGLWHLGCIYSVSLAKLGFEVWGFDLDKKIVNNLKKGVPPVYEPDLAKLLKKYNKKNLHFSSSLRQVLKYKKYIFITYDIPVDDNDIVNMDTIHKTINLLIRFYSPDTIFCISSQVPVGTTRSFVNLLEKKGIKNPKVIYFPENLRLGQAFDSFLNPQRIVLGSDNVAALNQFKRDFSFFSCPFITISLESAEMAKHALNTYLAMSISFASEMSDLSEKAGANMLDVVRSLKADKRVSPYAPINPGLGFAGGTLGRDIQTLRGLARKVRYKPKLLEAIYEINQDRLNMLLKKIKTIHPSLKGKTAGILGLTYKPDTDTLRRSMSLRLASLLKVRGCKIKAFDPIIQKRVYNFSFIQVCNNTKTFFKDLDLVILMTEWPEFKKMDVSSLASLMRNRVILDTRNFLNANIYKRNGFTYLGTGV